MKFCQILLYQTVLLFIVEDEFFRSVMILAREPTKSVLKNWKWYVRRHVTFVFAWKKVGYPGIRCRGGIVHVCIFSKYYNVLLFSFVYIFNFSTLLCWYFLFWIIYMVSFLPYFLLWPTLLQEIMKLMHHEIFVGKFNKQETKKLFCRMVSFGKHNKFIHLGLEKPI